MKPTPDQIQAEIQKLQALLKRLSVKHSGFGEDHEAALKVQIKVLEGAPYENFEDGEQSGAASDADYWRQNTDNPPASAGWEESPHLFA